MLTANSGVTHVPERAPDAWIPRERFYFHLGAEHVFLQKQTSFMKSRLRRRQFLSQALLGSTAFVTFPIVTAWGKASPNEKLNLGIIGVAGRGGDNLNALAGENIVALCDVDDQRLGNAAQRFPAAKTHSDFRRMIDQKDIDAVVVSTPDHTHAVAAVAALQSGRPVYCEKPLAHTVSEARIITNLARKKKLPTQLGTQIHAERNYRRVVELIQANAIGPVSEVHVWAAAVYGGKEKPKETPPVPAYLHYDLWLGPVEERPYSPEYLPFHWRDWWAFGGGSLADFGCHFMDLPFWALGLKYPLTVEPVDGPPVHAESTPPWLIARYEFPGQGSTTPLKFTWYHGGRHPAQLTGEQYNSYKSGVLFIGSKGSLISNYHQHALLPEKDFEGYARPAHSIPDSIGHHREWVQACKTGSPTTCNFDYSGPLTETALLGNVAYRVGRKLEWDPAKLKAGNCPEADQYLQHHYRAGWSI
jgi:predicted dehydrogenase